MSHDGDLGHAEARLWALLGRVLLDGFTGEAGALARSLPVLTPTIAGRGDDDLAAEHYALLGHAVPPFASVFLEEDGHIGGPVTAAARQALEATGADALRTDVEPDHLGCLLLGLSFLASAEADARDDGLDEAADRLRRQGDSLLREHVLGWLPALVVAVQQEGDGAIPRVLGLAAELAASRNLKGEPPPLRPEDLLDDPRTGLKAIARFLLSPARSGLYLTHGAIARVATAADIPAGFGDRYRMLEGLILASVDHGALETIARALRAEVVRWRAALIEIQGLGLSVHGWLLRLDRTEDILQRIAEVSAPRA